MFTFSWPFDMRSPLEEAKWGFESYGAFPLALLAMLSQAMLHVSP